MSNSRATGSSSSSTIWHLFAQTRGKAIMLQSDMLAGVMVQLLQQPSLSSREPLYL
jgi:hypothetical protein